jgi:hypothetical protein
MFVLLTACADDGGSALKHSGAGSETAEESGDARRDSGETGDSAAGGPCSDGGWGEVATDPTAAVQVRADGDDANDGSIAAPFLTLEAALEVTRAAGGAIFVGPGTFPTQLDLSDALADGATDDGLELTGCGPDEVTLQPEDEDRFVIRVSGVSVTLGGFSLAGGTRPLWTWQGATVSVQKTTIAAPKRVGIMVDGATTAFTGMGLVVQDTAADDGALGYAVAVQGGALTLTDSDISGAVGVGIFGDAAAVVLSGVTVEDVASDDGGALGRGVHVQDLATLAVTGGAFSGNADAAIFALSALSVTLEDTAISTTSAATLPDSAGTSGDGVVVAQADDEHDYDPSTFVVSMTGTEVTGSDRTGVLFDKVEVQALSGNDVSGNGYEVEGTGILLQDGAVVTDPGPDAYYDLDAGGVDALAIDVRQLDADGLAE